MARKASRKEKLPMVIIDECLPRQVADFFVWKGWAVGYAGEEALKGKKELELVGPDRLLVTKDERLLEPGRLPSRHGGVIVIEAGNKGSDEILSGLAWFWNSLQGEGGKQYFANLRNRRFLISGRSLSEVEPDGSIHLLYSEE